MGRNCPSEQDLIAFTQGKLPAATVDALADHLESCPHCEAIVERLEGVADPLIGALRLAIPSTVPFRSPHHSSLTDPAKWPSPPGYEIIAPLGRGGMGIVYRARQVRLQRLVALKRLPTGSARELERARIEAEALARLQHTNIVQIYEVVEHEGRAYLALELVEGGSLAARMTGKPQSPRESARLIETLARAMHYAHTNDVIHRDLKPANILLHIAEPEPPRDEDKPNQSAIRQLRAAIPKITDFGLAKRLAVNSGETRDGDVIGTPSYMSPEQAAGRIHLIGTATDIYSLGVVLYELLTGRVPLEGQSTIDTLILVRQEDPVSPRLLQPRISRDLETICLKCLEKSPGRRYVNALALAEDLRRFQANEPILARPVTAWERSWKWAKRQPVVAALSAAIVVGTILSLGVIFWQWQRAETKATAEEEARYAVQDRERKERAARRQVERLTAGFVLDQGVALCERGETGRGLLWQVRALELAVNNGDTDLERVVRSNLGGWQSFLVKPRIQVPHKGGWIWTVALSRDNQVAWTASDDGSVRRWDTTTGQPVGTPFRHPLPVWAMSLSPDGKLLLTGSGDDNSHQPGAAHLWNIATGIPVHAPLTFPSEVYQVAFHPKGTSFLTVCREHVRLWQTHNQQPIGAPLSHPRPEKDDRRVWPKLTAAYSPDGRLIATGGDDGSARLWDAATGQPKGEPLQTPGPVQVVAFSPDGRTLATGSFRGGVQRWDVATGKPLGAALAHRGRVKVLVFSPDGNLLATGGLVELDAAGTKKPRMWGEVYLWNALTGQRLGNPLDHPAPVWSLAFSPGGRLLLTGAEDGGARFFVVATGALLDRPKGHEGLVQAVTFSADGTLATTASAGGDGTTTVRVWNVPPERSLPRSLMQTSAVSGLAFSPEGRYLLSGGANGKVLLWDGLTGQPLPVPVMNHNDEVIGLAFHPDGRTFVTGDSGGEIRIWDRETGLLRKQLQQPGWTTWAAFSPDGRLLLVGGANRKNMEKGSFVHLWETTTYHPYCKSLEHLGGVWSASFSADGQQFFTTDLEGGRMWDLKTLRKEKAIAKINPCVFFPDGRRLLLVSGGFGQVWEVATGKSLGPCRFHAEGGIREVAFSPDGRSVLVANADKSARLWDVATGKLVGPPPGRWEVRTVAFSAKGNQLAAGSWDGHVALWDAPQPLGGSVAQIRLWMEVQTGMKLDTQEMIQELSVADVQERQHRLEELGGVPALLRPEEHGK